MSVESSASQLTPLQSAIYLLKQTQAKLAAIQKASTEPIAVLGMSCRFPGGDDPNEYWRLLSGGVDAITEVPADRWNIDDYYDADPTAPFKMNTRCGGFIRNVDEFDAEFFGISPREAVRVDPQQRLLLEVSWEALEDAGLPANKLGQTKTGVYVGALGFDYSMLQFKNPADLDIFSGTGASHSILANRLSYFLNLSGPSMALDTACSSSLVAIHLACQSLRRGESDLALAGGVNLILVPEMTLVLTKAHMMAPDGRCKTFDASADGYVRGEGCGMVVLKRLSDAVASGDRVLAVIRGSAVNHDGRSNGLSAPSGPAQEAVLKAALADGGLSPHEIDYIEAHGTGTRLGDPIEIEALRSVLCEGRSADHPLMVGSVKTNIGHLESAAGIAGLIKLIQMLRNRQVPPHLHLKTVNPLLRLEESPIEIPTSLREWKNGSAPRRAGVSGFGFGGTNAHVIVEEAPHVDRPQPSHSRPRHLLKLSARSPQALAELATRYADHAEAHPNTSLAELAQMANSGRADFDYRAAVAATSPAELKDQLRRFVSDPQSSSIASGQFAEDRAPRIAFLFTGQGAQYAGMGRVLYETQPTFRDALDRCAELLRTRLDRPLLSLLEPSAGHLLDQTGYTQPTMFALEYALACTWRSWGVEPAAVMGHSVGEFAAACIAGVLPLEDAIKLIAERARLMQSLPSGGVMAAVFAGETRVSALLEPWRDQVTIAALNGPENIVISGDEHAIRQVLARFETEHIKSKVLATSHAFHSHRMEPILGELRSVAESLRYAPPKIDIIANLTGQKATASTFSEPTYWTRHAREPVQFARSMQALADMGCELFLEIGPSPTLIGMGQRCINGGPYAWLPSLRSGRDDWQCLLDSLAQMYVRGAKIDWSGFDRDYRPRKAELPCYPFQRRRFWPNVSGDSGPRDLSASQDPILHPLLGRRLAVASDDHIFESQLAANRPQTLGDHKVQGVVVMPGAGYVEMALAAGNAAFGKSWIVDGLLLLEPLFLDKTPKTIQTIVSQSSPGAAAFRIVCVTRSEDDGKPVFTTLATGRLEAPREESAPPMDIEAEKLRFNGEPRDQAWQIEALRKSGLEPGPTFLWSPQYWVRENQAFSEARVGTDADHLEEYQAHPGMLDGGFQLLGSLLPGAGQGIDAYVPMGIDRTQMFDRLLEPAYYLATLKSLEGDIATGDIRVADKSGRILMIQEGIRLRRVPRDWLARKLAGPLPDWSYELAWTPQPLNPEPSPIDSASTESNRWLIFDSPDGTAADLAAKLEIKGHRARIMPAEMTPDDRRSATRDFLSSAENGEPGIVYLSGPATHAEQRSPEFETARSHGWGGALDVIHVIGEMLGSASPRLWLVTTGAQATGVHSQPVNLAQSPMWGLGRVLAAEQPSLSCTRVDLDPQSNSDASEQLVEELLFGNREDQVVYRGSERFVARLRRRRSSTAGALKLPGGQPYRLEITSRGQLNNVTLRPVLRGQPGPGQVEIKVRATGLNFRDVLNVLDLYPGDPGLLGGECAGEISAVGEGVQGFKPGDAVVALAPASFASYALTLAEFVAPKPEHLSFEEAATIPICFLTSHLALVQLGRLKAGERVLIHAATGGVGLSAIQIARHVGAEIFATAGNPRKREYLKELGIQHVMDSRSVTFADEILAATNGEGVDLIVNSLTGDAIRAGLSVLRKGGRFMELGKTDLWDQKRVDEFRPGVTFFPIALDHMMADEPQSVDRLMREVLPQFVERRLEPLPLQAHRIERMVDALRHMAKTEHIGKIVIQATEPSESGDHGVNLHEDGTYLVTGGSGGLGLKVARWLVDRGARHLVLSSRSGASPESRSQLDEMEKAGVAVSVRRCNVGNREEVAAMLTDIGRHMPPLRGVFHLAGVLDDGILAEQTRERFDRVMEPKALGAWHLHELTLDQPLDHFVLFSSAAALLGAPGQGNYAGANAFLDALAHHRRWQKRPALSINWGAWSEVGMAARLASAEGRRMSAAGVDSIDPARGLRLLEHYITEDCTQVGVLPINWKKFLERIPAGSEPAWLSDIARDARSADSSVDTRPVLLEELTKATPGERHELAVTRIRQMAARVLAIDESNLPDPRRALNELGFDSLTGVEFANRVGRSVGQHLNPALLFDYPTLEGLAGYVVRDMLKLETGGASSAAEAPAADAPAAEASEDEASRVETADQVESMSDKEMEEIVNRQLQSLQATPAVGDAVS